MHRMFYFERYCIYVREPKLVQIKEGAFQMEWKIDSNQIENELKLHFEAFNKMWKWGHDMLVAAYYGLENV